MTANGMVRVVAFKSPPELQDQIAHLRPPSPKSLDISRVSQPRNTRSMATVCSRVPWPFSSVNDGTRQHNYTSSFKISRCKPFILVLYFFPHDY